VDPLNQYLGAVLALLTALAWAGAVVLFKKSGETVHPIGLNLFKALLAAILLVPTIWISKEVLFYPAPWRIYALVMFSGALGIGIADTLFFKSLNIIGAGRIAVVDCLYSPFVIGLSYLFLGERLNLWQFVGVLLIISAVLSISSERKAKDISGRNLLKGVLFGALALACTASSLVMIKNLLEVSPLFWVTEIRLVGGSLVLLLILAAHPSRRKIVKSVLSVHSWAYTLFGSFMGSYVATVLWLGGMKYTEASIAAALNQTSNIFIFVFAAIFLRERATPLRILGILLGVGGALLVTFG